MNNSALILPTITLAFITTLFSFTLRSSGDGGFGGPTPINQLITNEMSEMEQTKSLDRDIETFMKYWGLRGGSFALMRNDSLLYAKAYGYADVEKEQRCEVENIFRVASVSKLITATAAMRLIEEGDLKLDSKVFGEKGILNDTLFLNIKSKNLEKITVEHLLRHTAGFSSPVGDPAFFNQNIANVLDKELPLSVDDLVLYATQNRLKTIPGSNYDYSNLGYIILGKVIEVASGMDYEKYVQREVLHPAECYDMHIGHSFVDNLADNEVHYYEVKEAEEVDAYDGSGRKVMKSEGGNNIQTLSGAGGWVASPVEILRLVASINGERGKQDILKRKTVEMMTYDSSSRSKKPMGWATVHGSEWIRSGSMAGTTALIKHQKDGYTWVFVVNSSSWNGHRLTNYMSSQISRSIAKVNRWPLRDLFQIRDMDIDVDVAAE